MHSCVAVNSIHSLNVVYRNLKPEVFILVVLLLIVFILIVLIASTSSTATSSLRHSCIPSCNHTSLLTVFAASCIPSCNHTSLLTVFAASMALHHTMRTDYRRFMTLSACRNHSSIFNILLVFSSKAHTRSM